MSLVEAPVEKTCAHCRRPANWLFDAATKSFQLFDAEPHASGTHVIHPVSGKALLIPWYEHDYWANQPIDKWVLHRRTCGVGPGPVHVGAALQRMARGDTRRSRQRFPPEPQVSGPSLIPNGRCENCDADVVWVETRQDGQRVPLEPKPHRSGLVTVSHDAEGHYTGTIEGFGARTGLPRYRNHHLACTAPASPRTIKRSARMASGQVSISGPFS